MIQEYIGAYRVARLDGILRLVNGRAILSKEEAAKVYRHPDKIQRLDDCSGNPTWINISPEEIGREPIRKWNQE